MMNMVVGILCEVVSAVASAEKEEAQIKLVKETILVMLQSIDMDGSHSISMEELMAMCEDADALTVLKDLHVDSGYLRESFQMLYQPGSSVPIVKVMEGIMNLRGSRPTTVKDIIDANAYTRYVVGNQITSLQSRLDSLIAGTPASWGNAAPGSL